MFASELNVRSVGVWVPFGRVTRTWPRAPVRALTRSAAIAAALRGPGAGPAMLRPSVN